MGIKIRIEQKETFFSAEKKDPSSEKFRISISDDNVFGDNSILGNCNDCFRSAFTHFKLTKNYLNILQFIVTILKSKVKL